MLPLMQAHPRVCGENYWFFPTPVFFVGSSPRVRGKRHTSIESCFDAGLIPACAGKTIFEATISTRFVAHPRVCGENNTIRTSELTGRGSSPRVRGKHRAGGAVGVLGRLIPACAGKTR